MLTSRTNYLVLVFVLATTTWFLSSQPALAARLFDVPVTVEQPDGTVLHIFASGDEYYNWLHDAKGFTIVQDLKTAFYVYADLLSGRLVPTAHIVGKADPSAAGLRPHLNVSPDQMEKVRQTKRQARASTRSLGPLIEKAAPKTGSFVNLTVFIRFSGESEFADAVSMYDNMFNDTTLGANSLKNYFREVSYNTLTINSNFYPTPPSSTIVSYQDGQVRNYYRPYHPISNTIGYVDDYDLTYREHTLLKNAIDSVNGLGQFPSGATIDADGDGEVDSMTFIVKGGPDAWADLLWPHAWSLYTYYVHINGKHVYRYNFQLETVTRTGVLAHEMFHVLGAPDLYHYSGDALNPAGVLWDLMDYNLNPPQHMTCYMKSRYGTWISSIPTITAPGTYTLNPLTSSTNNCFKIASPNSTTQYYVVEYRYGGSSTFESRIGYYADYGLIVYRINSAKDGQGNRDGPPDELYVYRPGGTVSADGDWYNAAFSSTAGQTRINDYYTDPKPFLSTGGAGGLHICNVSAIGATISFDYGPCSAVSNPSSWNFGNQLVGTTSAAKTFTVTNKNSVSITYGTLYVNNAEFTLTNDQCSNQSVAASGVCTFGITFKPSVSGSISGTVTIPNNVLAGSPDHAALSGTGNTLGTFLPLVIR